ncbi:hypothetical protein MMC30_004123 [Trapelia coarctata]|nr:hypothetical protein [Trapelia coarctata]
MEQTLYFAYGSNLSLTQMHARCPSSTYVGIGRLQGYQWIINTRGYANVVPNPSPSSNPTGSTSLAAQSAGTGSTTDQEDENVGVYGVIYALQPADEERLDMYEGVPEDYGKERLGVELWETAPKSDSEVVLILSGPGKAIMALVYVDGVRITEGIIREEYVFRMRRAFREAAEKGVFGKRFRLEEDGVAGSYIGGWRWGEGGCEL